MDIGKASSTAGPPFDPAVEPQRLIRPKGQASATKNARPENGTGVFVFLR